MPVTAVVAMVCLLAVLLSLPILRSKGLIGSKGSDQRSPKQGRKKRGQLKANQPGTDDWQSPYSQQQYAQAPYAVEEPGTLAAMPSAYPPGVYSPDPYSQQPYAQAEAAPLPSAAPPAVAVVASGWKGPDWDRQDAAMALAQQGNIAAQQMNELVQHDPQQARQWAAQVQLCLDGVQLVSAGVLPQRSEHPVALAQVVAAAAQASDTSTRVHIDLDPAQWQVQSGAADALGVVVANLLGPLLSAPQAQAVVQASAAHDGVQVVVADQPVVSAGPQASMLAPGNSFGLSQHQIEVATRCLLQPTGRQTSPQELALCVAGEAARALGVSVRVASTANGAVMATVALPYTLITAGLAAPGAQASLAAPNPVLDQAGPPAQAMPEQFNAEQINAGSHSSVQFVSEQPHFAQQAPMPQAPFAAVSPAEPFVVPEAADFTSSGQPHPPQPAPEPASAPTPTPAPTPPYSAGVSVLPGAAIPTPRREMSPHQVDAVVQQQSYPQPQQAPQQTPQPEFAAAGAQFAPMQAPAAALPAQFPAAAPAAQAPTVGQHPSPAAPAFDAFAPLPEQPHPNQVQIGATPPFALSNNENTDQAFQELTQALRHVQEQADPSAPPAS